MKYELTFLTKKDTELKNIKELIKHLKGKIIKEEKWGEKILAYFIKKNHTALFYNLQLEIDKKNIAELKKKLNFNDKILRYLLLVKE